MSKWLIGLAILVLVFGAIFGGRYYQDRSAAAAAAARGRPAAAVATATAREASWDTRVRALATLRAVEGTRISAQIAGNVTRIAFESGARVRRGELLVQLDDSTQQAALVSDQARLTSAAADLARAKRLVEAQAFSQEQLQVAQRDYDMAAAAVASDQAVLAKLRITAPFDGVLGIREVSLGQYVAPGTGIVDLQRLDPLLLDFALPQEQLAQLATGQEVTFTTSARPNESFTGKVTAIAARVDEDTRNIGVQATVRNADGRLRPGLFGQAMLGLDSVTQGIEVPQDAVAFSTLGNSVFVVGAGEGGGQVARAMLVQVLQQRDGNVLLDAEGIEPGTMVVTAGQNKLQDGAAVVVDNGAQP